MSLDKALIKERINFLSQSPEALRSVRGHALYDTLTSLGLTHNHYFRALDTNIEDYCAREFGIDLNRITVDRFFQSDPNAKWLFPDIVRDAVVEGLRVKPVHPSLIVRDEHVESAAYDVPYVVENAEEEELRSIAEGAAIPESQMVYGDRIVRLDKKGRGVIASYEVIRRMSVDMLRVHLRRMGERLGRDLDSRLATVLIEGDSSGETAATPINSLTAGSWGYADLLTAFGALGHVNGFTPTHILVSGATFIAIMNMDAFKDTVLFDFPKTGALPTPFGVKLVLMPGQPDDKITMIDAGYAVQKLTEQDLLVESDKLIQQQWDRTYLTVVTDFAILYDKARVVVNNDWEA